MPEDSRTKRVAVQLELSWPANRHYEVLSGIYDYAKTQPSWTVEVSRFPESRMEQGAIFDGVIGRIEPSLCSAAELAGIPVVNTWNSAPSANRMTNVLADISHASEISVKHLVARGIRRLGAIELLGDKGSNQHVAAAGRAALKGRASFSKIAVELNFEDSLDEWRPAITTISNLLSTVEPPFGLVLSSDPVALLACEAALDAGWRIPEDVAIVSIGNDAASRANLALAISSVDLGYRRIGFDAAAILNEQMNNGIQAPSTTLCEPKGLIVRQTSDVFAVADDQVAKALRFMADCVDCAIDVSQVVAATKLSRSSLQRRFHTAVGRTIHEELTRLRVERFKRLLAESDNSIRKVANEAGFANEATAYSALRKHAGMTPAAFRKAHTDRLQEW